MNCFECTARLEIVKKELSRAEIIQERLMKVLMGIYALLQPDDFEVNGKTFRFVSPIANEQLHELTKRIKAIQKNVTDAIEKEVTQQERFF